MRNIKVVVEYDGTDFHGFQRQAGDRTVQEELERAAARIMQEPITVIGAGRTDAGVHAWGQVINFRTRNAIPVERVCVALNSVLPADVAARAATEVDLDFHARFDARRRCYIYRIVNTPLRAPLSARYATWVREPLSVADMAEAASLFVGDHDFAAFCCSQGETQRTRRTVEHLEVRQESRGGPLCQPVITVEIAAPSFLYRMVRSIVGALLAVGQGRKTVADVARMLASGQRDVDCPVAPPQGLCLVAVSYGVEDENV
jgi:tRNA pseudouridine38-40 synthase